MPTTLSKQQIVNMALARIGVAPIDDIDAANDPVALDCRNAWEGALATHSRARDWNCLRRPLVLTQVVQDPLNPPTPIPSSTPWAPATNYAVGNYVTFGDPAYLYQCLIANLSSASFTNDLTAGFWFQTDIYDPNPFRPAGADYPSGWAYKYQLPDDFLLVCTLNDMSAEGHEEDWEVMENFLYCNEPQAVIKYIALTEDTTKFDAMFIECLTFKLAEMLATKLRQDDTNISRGMAREYERKLTAAGAKNGNERRSRRYDATQNSRWIAARRWSTNG